MCSEGGRPQIAGGTPISARQGLSPSESAAMDIHELQSRAPVALACLMHTGGGTAPGVYWPIRTTLPLKLGPVPQVEVPGGNTGLTTRP
jgi:hypothetical protein